MKNIVIFFTLFLVIASNSYGDWKYMAKNKDGDTFYIDLKSVKHQNNLTYVWTLTDKLIPSSTGVMSSRALFEIHCNQPQKAYQIAHSAFSLPMGEGSANSSYNKRIGPIYANGKNVISRFVNFVC